MSGWDMPPSVQLPGGLSSKVSQLEAKVSMIIDQLFGDWLTAQAKAFPRLRMNLGPCYSPIDHKSSIKDVSDLRG